VSIFPIWAYCQYCGDFDVRDGPENITVDLDRWISNGISRLHALKRTLTPSLSGISTTSSNVISSRKGRLPSANVQPAGSFLVPGVCFLYGFMFVPSSGRTVGTHEIGRPPNSSFGPVITQLFKNFGSRSF